MTAADPDLAIRLAVYGHFAETGRAPTVGRVAARAGATDASVHEAYARLRARRLLVLEPDGTTIRMAPPFSGVPTEHVVEAGGVTYHANCAWDALGVPAALHRNAVVHSRCSQSGDPLRLPVALDGPAPSDWLFHCPVPTAHWWDDIVFT